MATQYTGEDEFPVSLEIPDDNEGRAAASLNVPVEALADRTVNLKTTVDAIGTRLGAHRVRTEQSIPQLLLSEVPKKLGDICYVRGFGFYEYRAGYESRDDDKPWVVYDTADRAWVHTLADVVQHAATMPPTAYKKKLVAYDADGRIRAGEPRNGIVRLVEQSDLISPGVHYTSPTITDTVVEANLPGLVVSDIVDIDIAVGMSTASSEAGALSVAIRRSATGAPGDAAYTDVPFADLYEEFKATGRLRGRVTIGAVAAFNSIVLRAQGTGTKGPMLVGAWQISGTVYRP